MISPLSITNIWSASRIVLRKYIYHKSVELEDSSSTQKLSSDDTLQQSLALEWGERVWKFTVTRHQIGR
jgi:hypothetical protein